MISHAIGTVEFTGFEIMHMRASGHTLAMAVVKSATIVAFTLNKSSLVIPGFRGTPANFYIKFLISIPQKYD